MPEDRMPPPSTPPMFQFTDGASQYAFDIDRRPDVAPIRVRVASGPVGAVFDMSIVSAQRFSMLLSAAITQAISRGPGGTR